MLSCRIGLSPQKLPDSHVDNLAASWCPRIGSFTLWLKMFQAQEHAKEDGLRRVEASPTDADLGTLFPWGGSVTHVSGTICHLCLRSVSAPIYLPTREYLCDFV